MQSGGGVMQRDENDKPTDTTVPTPVDLARKAKP